MHSVVEEGGAEFVACEETTVADGGDEFVHAREDFFADGVDKTPTVIAADSGITFEIGHYVLVDGWENLTAEGVDEGAGEAETVDDDDDGGASFGEVAGFGKLEGDDELSLEVVVADAIVAEDKDTAFTRIVEIVVEAGDNLVTEAVDEAGVGFVGVDTAVSIVELVDVFVARLDNDGSVVALEAEEVAIAGGLNAVDID